RVARGRAFVRDGLHATDRRVDGSFRVVSPQKDGRRCDDRRRKWRSMSTTKRLWIDRGLVAGALLLASAVFFTRESVTTSEVEARSNNVLAVWRQADLAAVVLEAPHSLRLEKHTPEATGQAEW